MNIDQAKVEELMKAVENPHHVLEFYGPQRRLGHCQLIKTKTFLKRVLH